MPYVLNDEFSYWGNAAFFFKYRWNDVIYPLGYYSYGYSFILYFILLFTRDMSKAYSMGLVINIFIHVFSFWLSYSAAKYLFKNTDRKLLLAACLAVSLYPEFMVYTHITWSDTLLTFMMWFILNIFICLIKSDKKSFNIFLLACSLNYIYVVHQRALCIVVSGCFAVVFLFRKKIIKRKELLFFLTVMFFLFIGGSLLKNTLKAGIWTSTFSKTINETNDYGSILNYVMTLFSLNGIKKLFLSFISKITYMGIASCFLSWVGFFICIQKVKEKNKNRIIFIFLIISVLFSLIIATVFTADPVRLDLIVSGKYTDWINGPLLLIGLVGMLNGTISSKVMFLISGFLSICTLITHYAFEVSKLQTFSWLGSVSLGPFYESRIGYQNDFLYGALNVSILLAIIVFTALKSRKVMKYMGILVLSVFWGIQSMLGFERCETAYERSPAVDTEKINSIVADWDECELIYVYEKFERYMSIADLQFLNPDLPIQVIQFSDYDTNQNGPKKDNQFLVLEKEGMALEEVIKNYEIVEEAGPFVILK